MGNIKRYPIRPKKGETGSSKAGVNHNIITFPEIATALGVEAERATRELGLRASQPGGTARKFDASHVASRVLAAYFSAPKAERDAILRRGDEVMGELMESDRPIYFDPEGKGEPLVSGDRVVVEKPVKARRLPGNPRGASEHRAGEPHGHRGRAM